MIVLFCRSGLNPGIVIGIGLIVAIGAVTYVALSYWAKNFPEHFWDPEYFWDPSLPFCWIAG